MRRRAGTLLALAALVFGALIWNGTAALETPARVATLLLAGVLPPVLALQGTMTPTDVAQLRPLSVYASSLVLICALGILAWWGGAASGFTRESMGVVPVDFASGVLWTVAVVLFAIGVLALGRVLRWRETPMLELLLPRTAVERATFVVLSLGAGVFEELAYRGFLIAALRTASGSTALAVVVSSAAFGVMHGYQSATGALRAATLGAVLAVPLLATGSIVPSMAAHALYDVAAGLFLADWALRRPAASPLTG